MLYQKGKKYLAAFFATVCMSAAFQSVVFAEQVSMKLVYDGKSHNYSAEEIKINVNGNPITESTMPPVVLDGRTLVPARAVFEAIGAEVVWNGTTKEIYITKENDIVVIKVNDTKGTKNGEPFQMEVAPKIINDSTMIPVRQVAEQLDCIVGWDDQNRIVTITEEKEAAPEIPPVQEEPSEEKPSQEGTDPPVIGENSDTEIDIPATPPVVDTPVEIPTQIPNQNETSSITGTEISVQSILLPTGNSADFMINASGEIQKYQTMEVSENRLVVDIYDANMEIPNTDMPVTGISYVSSIRSAQNQVTPQKITRVVFDLTSACKYDISLSNDKKSIMIHFSENKITNISARGQGIMDYISIDGDAAPGIRITNLSNPRRIALDIPNAKSYLENSYSAQGCNYITEIRTSQYSQNSVRVELYVPEDLELEYSTSQNGTSTVVQIHKSSLQNLSYFSSERILQIKGIFGVNINQILHNDDYFNKKYTITLPGDFSSILGYGTIQMNDSYLNQVTVRNNAANQTEIVFDEAQILAYTVTEGANGLVIRVQLPKEKYNTVLILDAGHGKADPGTDGNGYIEKEINLIVLQKVYAKLQNDPNIKVYATRLDDSYPTNPERAALANEIADLFISIHQNSANPNPVPSGTEILYTPHSNEVEGKLTSKQAASVMLNYVVDAMGSKNRGVKNDPAIIVLNQTKVPAILIECGFLSNPEEASKLGSQQYQEMLAEAIVAGIHDIVNNYKLR